MTRYVLRRVLQAVLVLWAAYTISFLVLYLLPGNPVEIMAGGGESGQAATPAQMQALEREYGFDKPLPVQYADHLVAALHGDLGRSVHTGEPVGSMIGQALPPTLQLVVAAMVLAVVLGCGLTFLATYTRRGWLRQALLALPSLGVSIPTFWVGLMLVELVSFQWRLLPAFGNHGVQSMILPTLTLALLPTAVIAQILAKSMLANLTEPYVDTARAKGAGRPRVHFGHVLRNACLPALTVAAVLTGYLIANSVVVETVFSRNGIGRITVTAVTYRDLPVVQGVVLLGALAFVVINLVVDLVYPLLDPRIVIASPAGNRKTVPA